MADFLRCKDCKHDKGKCVGVSRRARHKNCFEPKVMTNADRIRAMSDEELAELFRDVYNAGGEYAENWYLSGSRTSCFDWDEEWLRQPAEGVG